MEYFKINGNDYSMYVNKLAVSTEHLYKAATTAAGNTVVKYTNTKRVFDVGIIPLDDNVLKALLDDVNQFQVTISLRNPLTGVVEENIKCMIPKHLVEYYTIQAEKVMYKAFTLQIQEL